MDADLLLVIGVTLGALSIPSFLNGYVESRLPRIAVLMLAAGVVLITLAVMTRPGGYAVQDVPDAFIRVIAGFLN